MWTCRRNVPGLHHFQVTLTQFDVHSARPSLINARPSRRRRAERELQLLIDYLCSCAGGPVYYRGRDMQLTHRGMRISESDWNVFLGHAAATLNKFEVSEAEQRDLVAFVQSLKKDIVE